ncbi:MAG: phospholipase D family protein [Alphaproteobacteria bacterium]|nr:phospholipase D family protein [Alphaproteobacteria bacterium]MCB9759452.1 phospholipase D family protein [Alphaproteobacteria bacterium]
MGLAKTDSLAVLDAVSPEPGWETTLALVSSYSVDLVAAAALVMALAGEGRDHEDMRHAALARACERMRDRFRVVCQAGRVTVPERRSQTALVLADRWFREVPRDGNKDSWHAKLALVRYAREDDPRQVTWRLWFGSRNLTQDTSWDSAVVAVGRPGRGDRISASIAAAGRLLAERAGLPGVQPAPLERELATVAWAWPDDVVRVRSWALWTGNERDVSLPGAPKGLSHLLAISPFADGGTLRDLGKLGGKSVPRWLLSSRETLDRVQGQKQQPLAGFHKLFALDAADPEAGGDEREGDEQDQIVEVHRGLHAKLLLMRTGATDRLWLGSANLTRRAWGGGNAECMAELEIKREVGDALIEEFVKSVADTVSEDQLACSPPPEDAEEKELDEVRNRIAAAWAQARLRVEGDRLWCDAGAPPVLKRDRVTLSVGLLGGGGLLAWRAGTRRMGLPKPPLPQLTELLVLELRSTVEPEQGVRWVARTPLDPPPGVKRDRAVLSRLMGPRAFLAWLRTLLQEIAGDEADPRWPPPKRSGRGAGGGGGLLLRAPTLEAVLRAWAKDREAVVRVDRAVRVWAAEIRAAYAGTEEPDEVEALKQLAAFDQSWAVVRAGLNLPTEDGG